MANGRRQRDRNARIRRADSVAFDFGLLARLAPARKSIEFGANAAKSLLSPDTTEGAAAIHLWTFVCWQRRFVWQLDAARGGQLHAEAYSIIAIDHGSIGSLSSMR
jgi:hypothetical protein